jgi:hypothetical protein
MDHAIINYLMFLMFMNSRDTADGIGTGYEQDDQRGGILSPSGGKKFPFPMSCRPALRPIQHPIQ